MMRKPVRVNFTAKLLAEIVYATSGALEIEIRIFCIFFSLQRGEYNKNVRAGHEIGFKS